MEASGEVVAAVQGQDFTNLSSPLPAEGYINFGIFGLIIFAIVYGLLVKKVDCYVFMSGNLLSYAYCFILPISFYLLRGALLSGWAYTFGYCVVLILIMKGVCVYNSLFQTKSINAQ